MRLHASHDSENVSILGFSITAIVRNIKNTQSPPTQSLFLCRKFYESLQLISTMEYQTIIFWGCIALVIILCFGHTAYSKLTSLNKKHHFIEIEHDSIYARTDDDDED